MNNTLKEPQRDLDLPENITAIAIVDYDMIRVSVYNYLRKIWKVETRQHEFLTEGNQNFRPTRYFKDPQNLTLYLC